MNRSMMRLAGALLVAGGVAISTGATVVDTSSTAVARDSRSVYSLTVRRDGRLRLARHDRRSLAVIGTEVDVGDSLSNLEIPRAFSPAGAHLALGIANPDAPSRSSELRFVALGRMRVVGAMMIGGNISQIVWLTPRRVLVFGEEDTGASRARAASLYVIDAADRRIVRKTVAPALDDLRVERGFVIGLHTLGRGRHPRLVRMSANGEVRAARIAISAGARFLTVKGVEYDVLRKPALAFGQAGRKAYVIAPGRRLVEVDTAKWAVTYRTVRGGLPPAVRLDESYAMTAAALGRRIAVSGVAATLPLDATRGTERPLGLSLVDTDRWTLTQADRHVSTDVMASGTVFLTFQFGRAIVLNRDLTKRFVVRDDAIDPNGVAFGCGRYVYFQTNSAPMTRRGSPGLALDVTQGRIVGRTAFADADLIWLDSPCTRLEE